MNKYTCAFCENIFVDYENESEKFEMFECPGCGSDNYFDETKNKKSSNCNWEHEEESLNDQAELSYLSEEV